MLARSTPQNVVRDIAYDLTFSSYVQHASSVRGEISATWLRQTAPFFWPARVGQTKPHKQTKDDFDTSDIEYLQNLPIKTTATLNGRVTCILAKRESQHRKDMLRGEEAQEVACLETPREAKEEQILEEALRNLQVCSSHSLFSIAERTWRTSYKTQDLVGNNLFFVADCQRRLMICCKF